MNDKYRRSPSSKHFIPTVLGQPTCNSLPLIQITVNGLLVLALVDTGAAKSITTRKLLRKLGPDVDYRSSRTPYLYGADGKAILTEGLLTANIRIAETELCHSLIVVATLPFDLILGVDILAACSCKIDITNKRLETDNGVVTFTNGPMFNRVWHLGMDMPKVTSTEEAEELVRRSSAEPQLQQKLSSLINEFHDIFAWNGTPPGRTSVAKHRINTGNTHPIRISHRRLPPQHQEEVHKLIDEMLNNNIIRPSDSPWSSPVVLVKKKDGKIRLCVDYRKLNEVTKKDSFPLPRIDDLLEALGGSTLFSTLDLASGYWQVEVEETDREKTAFSLPSGLYEFQTMPFGLTNAPATFQRLMQTVLRGLIPKACLVYLDDVIVTGQSSCEHLTNLREVFQRLKNVGLRLNPKKCQFLQKQVAYLGHIVSEKGIQTDPTKVEKVKNWPEPRSVEELKSFLGLASYYRKFVPKFSDKAAPLNALMNKEQPFVWGEAQHRAFNSLRSSLCESATLSFPDYSPMGGPFILDTDASDSGIGAVLSQRDVNNIEKVIAYGSRSLNKAERNYCTTRKEMLALVYFIKQYRHFLLGRHFIVRTDHKSLIWLQNFRDPEGQVARWQETLQEYDFECLHRPGRQHQNADALSRRPIRNHGDCPTCTNNFVATVNVQLSASNHWRIAQETDPDIGIIYQRLSASSNRPSSREMAGQGYESRCLWSLWDQLFLQDGVLFIQYGPNYTSRIVVPRELIPEVLSDLHAELGHCGINKLEMAARARFWWTHQHRDVVNFCNNCNHCGSFKNPTRMYRAPLQIIESGYPNEIVGIDLIGPLTETTRKNRYILVMIDYFTKWCEAVPIQSMDAVTVANAIIDQWICHWGAPEQLHSDRGRCFENTILQELCRILGIDKTRTTAYHPQGNGQVERTNRSIKSLLRAFTEENTNNWDQLLTKCLLAYRGAVHKSTGQTPHLMWTGREMRLATDVKLPAISKPKTTTLEFVYQTLDQIQKAHQLARRRLETAHRHQKDYYDKRVYGAPLRVGDKVWLHKPIPDPGTSAKLHKEWKGPYVVERVISGSNCIIRGIGPVTGPAFVAHFNHLKPYVADPIPEVGLELEVPAEGGMARAPGSVPS